ncbi:diacylglycerol/lipid kinase family protein [Paenarthrobacter aurescens]|uniref:diacylglycerol/lipid kinase family protein n=1 Tax=Paenarthrobacter aurescens TaxID=43663 RepID=UPI0021C08D71|nr:diacylglycerol kinase family protein [Paenarthrobacter aurescens]MCT9868121.1 diacylglycerol kinase family protein [Paenarthrobacter aurescens]
MTVLPLQYDRLVLLFNPASSHGSGDAAAQLREELHQRLPGMPVTALRTEYPGHGRTLASGAASVGTPLIVSVSGDGGYNDVVNGVMDAGGTAVCAVLPRGNANDHSRSTRREPLIDAIIAGQVRRIDLLRLSVEDGPESWSRYAHSYVGFGLTPAMAIGIEQGTKGTFSELVSVARTFSGLVPFELSRPDGARARFDSLILANIPGIAKYGRISETGEPNDGKFEVIGLPHAKRWRIALMALRAVTVGLGAQQSVGRYAFTTVDPVPLQIDGEVVNLGSRAHIEVESVHQALATIG